MEVGDQHHAPDALPQGNTPYPLYRGGPQGRCGRARKISPQPGFDPWTVQAVASRYTDWAIPAANFVNNLNNFPQYFNKLCAWYFIMFKWRWLRVEGNFTRTVWWYSTSAEDLWWVRVPLCYWCARLPSQAWNIKTPIHLVSTLGYKSRSNFCLRSHQTSQ